MNKIRRFVDPAHLRLKDNTESEAFRREGRQRKYLQTASRKLDLRDNDLIFITDLDEIVDYTSPALQEFLKTWDRKGAVYIINDLYYYDDECHYGIWWSSYFLTYKDFLKSDLNNLRWEANLPNRTQVKSGWHLTYFGGPEVVRKKLMSTAHTPQQKYANVSYIVDCIKDCRLIWKAAGSKRRRIPRFQNPYPPPRLDHIWNWTGSFIDSEN